MTIELKTVFFASSTDFSALLGTATPQASSSSHGAAALPTPYKPESNKVSQPSSFPKKFSRNSSLLFPKSATPKN